MDLAAFIGELLGIHGEVCVPGLGCFVKTRINSRYNESEHKFYPPANQVLFDPQTIDDDTLVEYISSKKNISVSSAKYFVEKYISNLKEQIALYEVAFTDIGWLYSEHGKLAFKAKETLSPIDPEFYGYSPVKLYRIGEQPAFEPEEDKKPAYEPLTTAAAPVTAVPAFTAGEPVSVAGELPEETLEEEYEERRSMSIWLVLATVLVVLGAAVFALYTFKPELFNRFKQPNKQSVAILPLAKQKPDTAAQKSDAAKTDTAAVAISPDSVIKLNPAQLTKVDHWELIAGESATKEKTNELLGTFQKMGLNPKVVDAPGPLTKISLGTYPTADAAEKAKENLISRHVLKNDPYTLEFKPTSNKQ